MQSARLGFFRAIIFPAYSPCKSACLDGSFVRDINNKTKRSNLVRRSGKTVACVGEGVEPTVRRIVLLINMKTYLQIALSLCAIALLSPNVAPAADAGVATAPALAADGKDMSAYKKLAEDALAQVKAGKQTDAHATTKTLEKAYDKGTKALKKADKTLWTKIDKQMDVAIDACGGTDAAAAERELNKFIEFLGLVK